MDAVRSESCQMNDVGLTIVEGTSWKRRRSVTSCGGRTMAKKVCSEARRSFDGIEMLTLRFPASSQSKARPHYCQSELGNNYIRLTILVLPAALGLQRMEAWRSISGLLIVLPVEVKNKNKHHLHVSCVAQCPRVRNGRYSLSNYLHTGCSCSVNRARSRGPAFQE